MATCRTSFAFEIINSTSSPNSTLAVMQPSKHRATIARSTSCSTSISTLLSQMRTRNRLIADATVETDRLDAKRPAHMLRSGMLAESYGPMDEIRELRDLVRTPRDSLMSKLTKNRVKVVLKHTYNAYDFELFGSNGREFSKEFSLSTPQRTVLLNSGGRRSRQNLSRCV